MPPRGTISRENAVVLKAERQVHVRASVRSCGGHLRCTYRCPLRAIKEDAVTKAVYMPP
jgi:MinD superfamily P-loop ATPase